MARIAPIVGLVSFLSIPISVFADEENMAHVDRDYSNFLRETNSSYNSALSSIKYQKETLSQLGLSNDNYTLANTSYDVSIDPKLGFTLDAKIIEKPAEIWVFENLTGYRIDDIQRRFNPNDESLEEDTVVQEQGGNWFIRTGKRIGALTSDAFKFTYRTTESIINFPFPQHCRKGLATLLLDEENVCKIYITGL